MRDSYTSIPQRIVWTLRSVPVFFKALGIGAMVAILFGSIILINTRQNLSANLYDVMASRTASETRALASRLERPMTLRDLVWAHKILDESVHNNPDMRYVIIRDADRKVVAHSFDSGLPADLIPAPPSSADADETIRVLDAGSYGLVFEASRELVKGLAGSIQVGVSDRMVREQVASLTRSILSGLAVSVATGIGLAAILTFLIVQPIQHLRQVAGQIKGGNFEVRSLIYSDDEIGELAVAFNEMAESLLNYRKKVEENEHVRRALMERVVTSHEDERKAISREMHDHLGQSLLAVLMDIRSSRDHAEPGSQTLQNLESRIEGIIDDLSRIVRGMRPSILDDYGLNFALESYVKEVGQRFVGQIAYKYSCPEGFGRLPSAVEVSLYRITQEAITNVIKHAQATYISLVLLVSSDSAILIIEDDGCGFDPAVSQAHGGLGLVGMRERAIMLGGNLQIESVPGEATTIRVTVSTKEGVDETYSLADRG